MKRIKFEAPPTNTQAPTIFNKEETLQGFEKYLLYRRGYSPVSVKAILANTRYLIEKLGIRYPDHDSDMLVKEVLTRNGLSNHTINLKLYCMEYLADYQHQDDPSYTPIRYDKLPETKLNMRGRVGLTIRQAATLLRTAERRSYRDHAIIATFLYAGLRCTELCNLDVSDVDLHQGYLWIRRSKNRTTDAAIIPDQLTHILKTWLRVRPSVESPALFITSRGNRFDRNSMHQLVANIGKTADIRDEEGRPVNVYPHLLRHTCGSTIIKLGGSLLDAQRQLRHKSLSTTVEVYLHADEEEVRKSLSKLKY